MSDPEGVTEYYECSILDTYSKWIILEERRTFSCRSVIWKLKTQLHLQTLHTLSASTGWLNKCVWISASQNSHNNQLQGGATESWASTGSIRWDWHTAHSTGTFKDLAVHLWNWILPWCLLCYLNFEIFCIMILTRNIVILTRKKLMYRNSEIKKQELFTPNANKSITDYYFKMEILGFWTTCINNCVKWLITMLILKVIVNRAENFTLKVILNRFYCLEIQRI